MTEILIIFLKALNPVGQYWIGARTTINTYGPFYWVDGTSFDFTVWTQGMFFSLGIC
jgi:hypothetical protein